jgi:hypothetical protein
MNHSEFDWDFENITHIARHGLTPEEAESVLSAQFSISDTKSTMVNCVTSK